VCVYKQVWVGYSKVKAVKTNQADNQTRQVGSQVARYTIGNEPYGKQ
jgi:hypothetical protein